MKEKIKRFLNIFIIAFPAVVVALGVLGITGAVQISKSIMSFIFILMGMIFLVIVILNNPKNE